MNFKECLSLACYDLARHKKSNVQIFVGLVLVAVVIMGFLSYYFGINGGLEEILALNSNANYIEIFDNADEDSVKNILKEQKNVDEIFSYKHCDTIILGNNSKLYFDGELLEQEMFGVDIEIHKNNKSILSNGFMSEFKARFKTDKVFSHGNSIQNNSQIVVPAGLLKQLGVDVSNALGKKIKIESLTQEYAGAELVYKVLLADSEIVGIIDERAEEMSRSYVYTTTIFTLQDNPNLSYGVKEISDYTRVNLKGYVNSMNTAKLLENKYGENVYYGGKSDVEKYKNLELQKLLTQKIFWVTGAVLIVGVLMCLYVVFWYGIKNKADFFGIVKSCGLTHFAMFKIYMLQILLMFILATISACLLNIIIVEVLKLISNAIVGQAIVVGVATYFLSSAIVFVFGLLCSVIAGIMVMLWFKKQPISRLLKN